MSFVQLLAWVPLFLEVPIRSRSHRTVHTKGNGLVGEDVMRDECMETFHHNSSIYVFLFKIFMVSFVYVTLI